MKIAYCSLLLPEEKKLIERAKGHLPLVSVHKFTKAIIHGLDCNLDAPVRVFNTINTLNYPRFPQLVFHKEKWSHTKTANDVHIGYINLFGIKYITQTFNLYKELDRWIKTTGDERIIVCVHHSYYPMVKATLNIKKKYQQKIITCLITGDVPGQLAFKSRNSLSVKQRLIRKMDKKMLLLIKSFDCYVLQTKYMAECFSVEDKPVCVVECAYLPNTDDSTVGKKQYNSANKKVVFYAGSLREEYGSLHLLNAIKQIEGDDYEFWIAGSSGGDIVDRIIKLSSEDHRIKYLGFISPEEVADRQQCSTVLVSPRRSNEVFVKYSFPSKTMECLASGKPYIAHKLPCEPEEYGDYIQYPEDESDESLAQKIVEICCMSDEERRIIGERGRRFVVNEKNPTAMCKKIVEFWSSLV